MFVFLLFSVTVWLRRFYQMGRGTLTRAPIQELYDPTFESVASLDDLQRSWETLKNVVRDLSPFIMVMFAPTSTVLQFIL